MIGTKHFKGQSQLIGVVLLTLILITMIGITYMWGMPLIEKQKDTVKVSNAERLIKELDKKIQNVVKNGGTQKIDNPNIGGTLKLIDTGINDRIELRVQTTGTDIATGKDIYLRGNDEEEIYLGGEAGVIKVFSEDLGDNTYDVTMTLYYRNVTGSENIYLIDIFGLGRDSISGDGHSIIITEGDTPQGPVEERDGMDVYVTRVNIRFE